MILWGTLLALVAAAVLGAVWRLWGRRAGRGEAEPAEVRLPDEPPLQAWVWLLRSSRKLDAAVLAHQVERALDIVLSDDPQSDAFLVGVSPAYMVQLDGRTFMIHHGGRRYMEDGAPTADPRLRRALGEHRAWLSVDWLSPYARPGSSELAEAYRVLGRIAAELANEDCLALYNPATRQLLPHHARLLEQLRHGALPQEMEGVSYVPVYQVSDRDARLQAAVEQARATWPRFVMAFENRRDEQVFSVKGPFRTASHEEEFMWLRVTALEHGVIYGVLDNDSVHDPTLHAGQRVRLRVEQLNDWLFHDGRRMHGGFTVKAVKDARNPAKRDRTA